MPETEPDPNPSLTPMDWLAALDATDNDQLRALADLWHEQADYCYASESARIQGYGRGYRSCAEDLERVIRHG